MGKHAYLIMAYNNYSQLKKLVTLLDDVRNDIYIHIDKRAKNFSEGIFKDIGSYSKITFIERKKVYWASYAQVETTLRLIEKAYCCGDYRYFHLLSGHDLPLHTQDEIHSFFDDHQEEFIAIVPFLSDYTISHLRYFYPLLSCSLYRNSRTLRIITKLLCNVQRLCGINRVENNTTIFVDGWTWFSITKKFAEYVLSEQTQLFHIYHDGMATDEIFIQTLAYNSTFRDKLFCMTDLRLGSMRHIDWKRGRPYIFRNDDYEELISSPYMFARKFDEQVDSVIIDRIADHLTRRGKDNRL